MSEQVSERYVCTAEAPWTEDKGRATHPDAKFLYSDDFHSLDVADRYECPHCGKRFWVQVAD